MTFSLQSICQMVMVAQLIMIFFILVHGDFHGSGGRKPGGFRGFIGSLVVITLISWLWYGAGAFSLIIGGQ